MRRALNTQGYGRTIEAILDPCIVDGAMNPDASTHLLVTSYGKEIWVEKATVEDEWVAAYRLMIKGGRLVVAEVRLFPADHAADRGPGEWSVEASAVPPEGVPARALRALSPTVPQERFPRFLRDIEKQYPRIAKQLQRAFYQFTGERDLHALL